jgi:oligopeptidase B
LQRLLYKEFVSRLDETEETAKVELPDGYLYFSKKSPGEEYRLHCRMKKDTATSVEEVYLNENELVNAKEFVDASFFHLTFLKHSPDCSLLAYGVDTRGNERNTVFFMRMDTKEVLNDRIDGVYEDFEFSDCGQYVSIATKPLSLLRGLNAILNRCIILFWTIRNALTSLSVTKWATELTRTSCYTTRKTKCFI